MHRIDMGMISDEEEGRRAGMKACTPTAALHEISTTDTSYKLVNLSTRPPAGGGSSAQRDERQLTQFLVDQIRADSWR